MHDDSKTPTAPDPGPPAGTPVSSEPATAPGPEAASTAPVTTAPGTPPAAEVRSQNRIALMGTVVLIVALAAGGAFLLGRGTGSGEPPVGVAPTPTAAQAVNPSLTAPAPLASEGPISRLPSDGSRLGSADAKVVVEYWADYQCPACALFAQQRMPDLFPLIEDGTIALVHRDFAFIGPESFDAAIAVRCAGREGRYWEMHDAVYAAQAGENEGAFARDRLVAIGATVGVDGAVLEACFDDRTLRLDVLDDIAAANRTAVASTPSIDINGTRFAGVPGAGEMEAAIAAAVAGASPQPLPTQPPLPDPWAGVGAAGREAGAASAPVTVDLWMDYQSPDSAVVAEALGAELRSRVEGGSIRVVRRDLALLGGESVVAATAVRCVDAQGGPAWLLHDILSTSARGAETGIYTADNLLAFSAQLGLQVKVLDACLGDADVAQAVRDETAAGQALGVDAGPTIIVSAGGREVARFAGPLDVDKVIDAIDQAG